MCCVFLFRAERAEFNGIFTRNNRASSSDDSNLVYGVAVLVATLVSTNIWQLVFDIGRRQELMPTVTMASGGRAAVYLGTCDANPFSHTHAVVSFCSLLSDRVRQKTTTGFKTLSQLRTTGTGVWPFSLTPADLFNTMSLADYKHHCTFV
ncbi:hypothetical protein MHYP_G00074010 [Metynnis hypsauchen]